MHGYSRRTRPWLLQACFFINPSLLEWSKLLFAFRKEMWGIWRLAWHFGSSQAFVGADSGWCGERGTFWGTGGSGQRAKVTLYLEPLVLWVFLLCPSIVDTSSPATESSWILMMTMMSGFMHLSMAEVSRGFHCVCLMSCLWYSLWNTREFQDVKLKVPSNVILFTLW